LDEPTWRVVLRFTARFALRAVPGFSYMRRRRRNASSRAVGVKRGSRAHP
jgi:hypothetical protein